MEDSEEGQRQKAQTMRKRCNGSCPGTPEPGYTTQRFERRGSAVKVSIRGIPATICPICHQTYVSRETGRQIDLMLEPFHGKHERTPLLPPAEVAIDFQEAIAALKAA